MTPCTTTRRLTSIARSQRASPSSSRSPPIPMPALLKIRSRRPCMETVSSTICATATASRTSTPAAVAPRSPATRRAPSSFRSATTTVSPRAASALHSASPMPDPPPVTIAMRPATRRRIYAAPAREVKARTGPRLRAMSPEPAPTLPHGEPVAVELSRAIHGGDLDTLRRLLGERPELANVRMIGRKGLEGGWRTPLHAATDWPGYFPAAPASVALLLEAGADPNDHTGGDRPETPLHWAASTDDVDVAVVLVDGGAELETAGGSIGTPLDNAVGYGCWHVARLLVERGAPVEKLWHAAALGLLDRLEELLAATPPPAAEDVTHAFWQACHGGQRRTAERLLAAGADINASPDYAAGQT